MEYYIHPHTGVVLEVKYYIEDPDGFRQYADEEVINELIASGEVVIDG